MSHENIKKEDEAIAYHHAEMQSYTDAQLLKIINEKSPRDLQHIAAKLTLLEKSKMDSDKKHAQSMSEIVKANRLSFIILVITALTFFIAIFDFIHNNFAAHPGDQGKPQVESQQIKSLGSVSQPLKRSVQKKK